MKRFILYLVQWAMFLLMSLSAYSQEALILKKRLAVVNFTDGTEGQVKVAAVHTSDRNYRASQQTVATSNYSHTLVTMLSTELVKSGAFILVERQQLDEVFKEQDLGASGATTRESAAKLSQILGVQLLVTGSITEWGNKLENSQNSVRRYFGSSKTKSTARIALDLRIIDASTGEIVMAESASGSAVAEAKGVKVMGIGNTEAVNDNTLLDSALRKAVVNCVDLIKTASQKVLWQGSVVKVNADGTAVIKPGSDSGIKPGMVFKIMSKGEELKDPDTGLSLGFQVKEAGALVITGEFGTGGKAATAKITSGKGIKTGDILQPK